MSLKRNWELIKFLATCNRSSFRCFKPNEDFLTAVGEIVENLLYNQLPLLSTEITVLKRHKKALIALCEKNPSPKHLTFAVAKAIFVPTIRLLDGS